MSELGRIPALRTLWLRNGSEVGINGLAPGAPLYSRGLVDTPDAGPDASPWAEHATPMILPSGEYSPLYQLVNHGWAAPGSESFWVSTQSTYFPPMFNPAGLVRLRQVDATTFAGEVTGIGAGPFAAFSRRGRRRALRRPQARRRTSDLRRRVHDRRER